MEPARHIEIVAQDLGVNMSAKVAKYLEPDVTQSVLALIQEAQKYSRHSKSTKLRVDDVNRALQQTGKQPLFGYNSPTKATFRQLVPGVFREEKYSEQVDFDKILSMNLTTVPADYAVSSHWLAVDGVQPRVPENYTVPKSTKSRNSSGSTQGRLKSVTLHSRNNNGNVVTTPSNVVASASGPGKAVVAQVLSDEQKKYYEAVVQRLNAAHDDGTYMNTILQVSKDPAANVLVPFFVKFVSDEVPRSLQQISRLLMLVAFVDGLIRSTSLTIEPYLHQLLPSLLTCVLAKHLSAKPSDNHWRLREKAANAIAFICHRYEKAYPDLPLRVCKTYSQALDTEAKGLNSHYGAIVGIRLIGPAAIETNLFPRLLERVNALQMRQSSSEDVLLAVAAEKCLSALQQAAIVYLQSTQQPRSRGKRKFTAIQASEHYESLYEAFGEPLVQSLTANSM